jgi:hypothetical protein
MKATRRWMMGFKILSQAECDAAKAKAAATPEKPR